MHERDDVDLASVETAAAQYLTALGASLESDGLRGASERMARAYSELMGARSFDLTTFPDDEGNDELVLAAAILVRSACEHYALPFVGAYWLSDQLRRPGGVDVVIEVEHTCVTLRGVQATGSSAVTPSLLGSLRADARSRQEFFAQANDRARRPA